MGIFSQSSSVGSRSFISTCTGPVITVGMVSSPEVDGICVSERMPQRNDDSRSNGAIEITTHHTNANWSLPWRRTYWINGQKGKGVITMAWIPPSLQSSLGRYKKLLIISLAALSSIIARQRNLQRSRSTHNSSSCFKTSASGKAMAAYRLFSSSVGGSRDLKPDGRKEGSCLPHSASLAWRYSVSLTWQSSMSTPSLIDLKSF